MRRGSAFAIAVLTVLPAAFAAEVVGEVTISRLDFPPNASTEPRALAGYIRDATGITKLTVHFEGLEVRSFEKNELYVQGGILPGATIEKPGRVERRWHADSADLELIAGQAAGYLALDFSLEGTLAAQPNGASDTTPSPPGFFPEGTAVAAPPEWHGYAIQREAPFLVHNMTGSIAYDGPLVAKILGPDVQLTTDRNTTRWSTGATRESDVEVNFKWLYLKATRAVVSLETDTLLELAEAGADFRAGALAMQARSGSVSLAGEVHNVTPGALTFEGALTGRIEPTSDGQAAELVVSGDVAASNIGGRTVVPAPAGSPILPWVLGLLGAAIVAGAAFARLRKREKVVAVVDVDTETLRNDLAYLTYYAGEASARQDQHLALEYLTLAADLDPTNPEVITDRALMLRALSESEGPELLDEAARLMEVAGGLVEPTNGWPCVYAAGFHMLRAARNDSVAADALAAAMAQLRHAIERDPELVGHVQNDARFLPLAGAEFEALCSSAHQRLEEGWGR